MDTLDYRSHAADLESLSRAGTDLLTADIIENHTFDELAIGDTAQIVRTFTQDDIELFANVSGDVNPSHLDHAYADATKFHGVIAHGMLGGSLFSTVLGTMLPGAGTVYLAQDLHFRRTVKPGDTLTARVVVRETHADSNRVVLDCVCTNQNGKEVTPVPPRSSRPLRKCAGAAWRCPRYPWSAMRPTTTCWPERTDCRRCRPPSSTPATRTAWAVRWRRQRRDSSLPSWSARKQKSGRPRPRPGFDLSGIQILNTEHSHAAAEVAVGLARDGKVQALMKGSLHTDELMHEVMRRDNRLRTDRRISHAYVMLLATSERPLILSDCAVNIAPELVDKVDIVQNAIDLAIALGIVVPKVAVLAAVETVTARMQSTIDAAALCKMADRGQIRGGLLDGPLAFDNAISADAARKKGIVSAVAGYPDILIVPNLEAGNMLAKQMTFSGGADAAGIVLGASVPIILTSRADSIRTRLASCAVAALAAQAQVASPGIRQGFGSARRPRSAATAGR